MSGGIDSSTIVMLTAQLAPEHTRHAFTAGFPGFARDETRFARTAGELVGDVARPVGTVFGDIVGGIAAATALDAFLTRRRTALLGLPLTPAG